MPAPSTCIQLYLIVSLLQAWPVRRAVIVVRATLRCYLCQKFVRDLSVLALRSSPRAEQQILVEITSWIFSFLRSICNRIKLWSKHRHFRISTFRWEKLDGAYYLPHTLVCQMADPWRVCSAIILILFRRQALLFCT